MIIRRMLEDAPTFTAFKGEAQCRITDNQWSLFAIDGGTVLTDEVLTEACRRGIDVSRNCNSMYVEPEFDEDFRDEVPDGEDADAVLAYLNAGGMVAKLPDELTGDNSKYCRFYVIMRAHTWYEPDKEACGCRCEPDPPWPVHDTPELGDKGSGGTNENSGID